MATFNEATTIKGVSVTGTIRSQELRADFGNLSGSKLRFGTTAISATIYEPGIYIIAPNKYKAYTSVLTITPENSSTTLSSYGGIVIIDYVGTGYKVIKGMLNNPGTGPDFSMKIINIAGNITISSSNASFKIAKITGVVS